MAMLKSDSNFKVQNLFFTIFFMEKGKRYQNNFFFLHYISYSSNNIFF